MERNWPWRRTPKKSTGETESSSSSTSHSGRDSEDQDWNRSISSRTSRNKNQSPEVTSKAVEEDVYETVKKLQKKLSTALWDISYRDNLVNQHAKVAEEAVAGWEKAESEVSSIKQLLAATIKKNSELENQISNFNGPIKTRSVDSISEREVEWRIRDAIIEKTQEFEASKSELEKKIIELQSQIQDERSNLDAANKENSSLKMELLARRKEIEDRNLELEMSTHIAETASKLHLESTKKVTKLEAECRKLHALHRKASLFNENLSDNGEVDLYQVKKGEAVGNRLDHSSAKIDLMDDFLEMERFVRFSGNESHGKYDEETIQSKSDLKAMIERTNELETKMGKMEVEKDIEIQSMIERTFELENQIQQIKIEREELKISLADWRNRFEMERKQLIEVKTILIELQKKLQFANASNRNFQNEIESLTAEKLVVESQREEAEKKITEFQAKLDSIESEIEEEKAFSLKVTEKCQYLQKELSRRTLETELRQAIHLDGDFRIKQEEELAMASMKLKECQETIASLSNQLRSLAHFDEFNADLEDREINGGTPLFM